MRPDPIPTAAECIEHCGRPGVVTCHRCGERVCARCAAAHLGGPVCRVLAAAADAEWARLERDGIGRREEP